MSKEEKTITFNHEIESYREAISFSKEEEQTVIEDLSLITASLANKDINLSQTAELVHLTFNRKDLIFLVTTYISLVVRMNKKGKI